MPTLYMIRTPGSKDFPKLTHLTEGRVFDGVPKGDADKLIEAGIAVEFDEDNELHVKAVEEFDHLDARRGTPVAAKPQPAPKSSGGATAPDYEGQTVEELHKVAADRNLEGRAGLNKADLIKLIEKDDAAKAKARK